MSKNRIQKDHPQVLFISYFFPPTENVAGSIRSESFVQNLKDLGWKATVLASAEKADIKEKYSDVIRIPTLLPRTKRFHLAPYGWIPPLVLKSLKLLKRRTFNAIYVTLPPFPTSIAMFALSNLTKVPIVIDIRDAWVLGPYRKDGVAERLVHKWIYTWLERRLINTAKAFIVNTPSAYDVYRKAYPEAIDKIHYIPNGYTEEDFTGIEESEGTRDDFILLHCGTFGISGRDPKPILMALKSAIESGRKITLKVVGQTCNRLMVLADQAGVAHCIQAVPPVQHHNALKAQINCDALLLYQAKSSSSISAVAGKTFEYIRIGKPILAVTPDGDNRKIIRDYAGYSEFADSDNIYEITAALKNMVDAKAKGTLPRIIDTNPNFLKNFERKQLAKRLATILDETKTHA